MIYFIDEDVNETEPYVYHMRFLGYEATVIDNADDAFELLVNASDIDAVILDVMLATKKSESSRFNALSTNNFVTTGLKLLDDLVQQGNENNAGKIPEKVVLFSAATRQEIVSQITSKKEEHGVIYLNKLEYDDVDDFAEIIIELINGG
jgi:CheY-like chemotaxis protein